jgi:uncharacterized protein
MKPKEKHILETFKHMLEQRVHLSTFALFGSRARGDAGRYSDMDVLVVVDQLDTPTADYISDCAWESGFGSGIVVVPVSYSKFLFQHRMGKQIIPIRSWGRVSYAPCLWAIRRFSESFSQESAPDSDRWTSGLD